MCGIAGVIRRNGGLVEQSMLERMSCALQHRGPDGDGVWVHGNVGFAHRRLSIIDLTAAASQPMVGPDGSVLVYNGAIYNFRELRVGAGSRRAIGSRSDRRHRSAAARAATAGAWRALDRLNGMFAFVVGGTRRRREP